MKKSVKKKWVELLRSGELKQTTGCLNRVTKNFAMGDGRELVEESYYCCLGVLSLIGMVEGKCEYTPPPSGEGAARFGNDAVDWHGNSALLAGISEYPTKSILDWAKLDGTTIKTLAQMNDAGESFEEIANYIEEKL